MLNLVAQLKLSFGKWFKLMRENAGLSQTAIGDVLGVKPQTIYNWESENSVPSLNPTQTYLLCDALKVSLEQLHKAFSGEAEISV